MAELLGCARVSTTDQDAALRLDALTAAGCHRMFTDTMSGSLERRPEVEKLLDQLRPGGHPGRLAAGPVGPLHPASERSAASAG